MMRLLNLLLFTTVATVAQTSVHEFQVTDIEGKVLDLSKFKGKKMLIVNTASKCGFTPQYKDLEELSNTYKESLVVIGFPANNFGKQEPGTDQDIKSFCEKNYGVSFPIAAKSSVKGEDISPLFKYLTNTKNDEFVGPILWNFEKFLIDENGHLISRFRSFVKPSSKQITKYL